MTYAASAGRGGGRSQPDKNAYQQEKRRLTTPVERFEFGKQVNKLMDKD